MHPGMLNLKQFSDAQLEEKIQKLNRVYFVTHNEDVRHQVILSLDTLKMELEERRATQRAKDLQDSRDNGLDSLINIS
jgi:hypothetical protein|tara:strand:+ start:649 stop:882 length:234 start_codon:yes stop_codon:yes gene_type:complete